MSTFLEKTINLARRVNTFGLSTAAALTVMESISITKVISVKVRDHKLFVRTSTPDFRVLASNLGEEFEPLRSLFPANYDGIIVDAGGYIGTAAIKFSEMFPDARIVSIEPATENFELLKKNVEHIDNITAIKAALVPIFSEDISLLNRGSGQWGYTIVDKPLDNPDAMGIERTKTITLDQIKEMFHGSEIGLLKLDIEGGEKNIFENGGPSLQSVYAVFAELHDRIIDGCTETFLAFSANRVHLTLGGEKHLSVRK